MPVNVAEEIGDFGHSADMLDDDVKSTRFIASCLWIAIVEAFRDLVHHATRQRPQPIQHLLICLLRLAQSLQRLQNNSEWPFDNPYRFAKEAN